MLQNGLDQGSPVLQEVDRRLENTYSALIGNLGLEEDRAVISTDLIVKTLDAVKHQVNFATNTSSLTSSSFDVAGINQPSGDLTANQVIAEPYNVTSMAARPRLCWECRSPDHFADQWLSLRLNNHCLSTKVPQQNFCPPPVQKHWYQSFFSNCGPVWYGWHIPNCWQTTVSTSTHLRRRHQVEPAI